MLVVIVKEARAFRKVMPVHKVKVSPAQTAEDPNLPLINPLILFSIQTIFKLMPPSECSDRVRTLSFHYFSTAIAQPNTDSLPVSHLPLSRQVVKNPAATKPCYRTEGLFQMRDYAENSKTWIRDAPLIVSSLLHHAMFCR
jgi:hypothetical protein